MLQNYVKIAWRNLVNGKLFSIINLTGLSIGTAVVIILLLFVKNEWSFDKFHSKSDQIHRTWVKEYFKGELIWNSVTPLLLGDELKNNFPEIKESTRYMSNTSLVKNGAFSESEKVFYVDPSFLTMFDFPLIKGKKEAALSQPSQIVITEKMGEKYFGNNAPIGQNISLQIDGEWVDFLISGIIEKAPINSSIQYDILIPFEYTNNFFGEGTRNCWTCVFGETYVQIDPNTNIENLHTKIASFMDDKNIGDYKSGEYVVGLQPLTDIHLNNDIPVGEVSVSDSRYPYILAWVALLILLLACINFTTLSVGRSLTRAKEVGVRKVTGATNWQLRAQFWSEAILTSGVALVIGLVLAQLLLPLFNSLAASQLVLEASLENVTFFVGLGLMLGLLSGAYPAIILSRFSPIKAIRGAISSKGNDKHLVLRGLVGFQFVLSIFLIICAFGMNKQMHFLQNKNLGFSEDQTVIVPFNGSGQSFTQTWREADQLKQVLRNELGAGKGVKNIISSSHTFGTQGWLQLGYVDPITDGFRQFYAQKIDEEYLDVMEMNIVEGRNFSKEIKTDSNGVIVNETFAKKWELKDPIGATMPEPWEEFQIIGVAKDFHFQSLHTNVEPLIMTLDIIGFNRVAPDRNFTDSPIPKLSFKVSGDNLPVTLSNIQREMKNAAPEAVFAYTFMDKNIGRQYESEQLLSRILSLATALAIFIACLGLFGIATLTIAQKTKEIGVRKVLGASTSNIVLMLNKNFSILVLVATLVATPIAWYFMKEWLADFAFQTDLNIWLFVFSGLAVLVIAWISAGFQSWRAAMANPVESLRSE